MKKFCVLILCSLFLGFNLYGQKLGELYKKEVINLIPNEGFGKNTNWDTLFNKATQEPGKRKSLIIAPNGSIFVSQSNRHEIWKFDSNGNFVKRIGKKGTKQDEFPYTPSIEGTFNNQYIYTNDVHGRMKFFDFDGKFIKMLKLDYMPLNTVPLRDNKIAVLGFVVGNNSRHIVSIKDFNTGTEKIILSEPSYSSERSITINYPQGGMFGFIAPYSETTPGIGANSKGNLVLALRKSGTVEEYTPDGTKISSFKLNIEPIKITQDDINKSYENGLKIVGTISENLNKTPEGKKLSKEEKDKIINQARSQMERLKDPKMYPAHLPYFSNMIIDSEGNMLFFEYTKEDEPINNHFKAYSYDMKGKYLGASSFKSENIDFSFNSDRFIFSNGSIYTISKVKTKGTEQWRIIKMELK